jgi:hypothetical protein
MQHQLLALVILSLVGFCTSAFTLNQNVTNQNVYFLAGETRAYAKVSQPRFLWTSISVNYDLVAKQNGLKVYAGYSAYPVGARNETQLAADDKGAGPVLFAKMSDLATILGDTTIYFTFMRSSGSGLSQNLQVSIQSGWGSASDIVDWVKQFLAYIIVGAVVSFIVLVVIPVITCVLACCGCLTCCCAAAQSSDRKPLMQDVVYVNQPYTQPNMYPNTGSTGYAV